MIKELKSPKDKFKFRFEYNELKDGQYKADIIKYKKKLTFFSGIYNNPEQYGKINFEVVDKILYVTSFELKDNRRKPFAAFVRETETLFTLFFNSIKEEEKLSEVRFDSNLFGQNFMMD